MYINYEWYGYIIHLDRKGSDVVPDFIYKRLLEYAKE